MLTTSSFTTRTNTPAASSPTAAAYPPDVLDVAVEEVKMAESRVLLIMTGNFLAKHPIAFIQESADPEVTC